MNESTVDKVMNDFDRAKAAYCISKSDMKENNHYLLSDYDGSEPRLVHCYRSGELLYASFSYIDSLKYGRFIPVDDIDEKERIYKIKISITK